MSFSDERHALEFAFRAYNRRGEVTNAVVSAEGAQTNASAYSFDYIGNLLALSESVGGAQPTSTSYVANGVNQYLSMTSGGETTWTLYSTNGELVRTRFGAPRYDYDAESRLSAVVEEVSVYPTNSVYTVVDELIVSNRYDHLGRRVQKITPEATHTYFYDGWMLVKEVVANVDESRSVIEYHWGKDLSGTIGGAGGVGGLLYLTISNSSTTNSSTRQLYVPWYDAYGNVMGYWDAQGNVVAEYTYDAFGKLIASSGPMADVFSFRYSTKYFDPETGFYYYGYRYYSPELMRWITRDPIGEEGGVNLYAMCGNSITWQIDYLGLIDVFWREPTATESSKISAAVREIVEISDLYLRRIAIFRERYFPQVVNYPRNVWFVPRERDRSADLSYLPYALKEGFHLEEHRDRGTLNMALLQIENRLKKEKEILNFTGFRVQTCRNVWCRLWGALAYRQLSIIGFCNRAFESDDYEFQNIVAHEASHMFHSTQDYYSTQDIDKCLSDAYAWGILYEARPAPPPHW